MTALTPLTDTQLLLLSRASQRDDGLLVPVDTLRGGAARRVASKLLIAELVAEVPVGPDNPHWFRDEVAGRWVGLKVTPAGLRAIGIEAAGPDGAEASLTPEPIIPSIPRQPRQSASPREGTKRALVIGLLERPAGATLDELVAATGWLPHTTRAALTGLRQKGLTLAKSRNEASCTAYRIISDVPSPEPATTAADTHAEEV
ncbi:DUF3489 domain-containing protein [Salinarimonas soli]|uniref:DUF3489 domain-containing protein n=1 Tax=Salinarimonas soli TaxID=1638099 RepID=A0A5B2VAH1_9HYPH|nr:DUF3489 domain-containing protein [Salinarimonas soli]KAA2235984.1 DUF3489 domain-containing protein [Salinarimonas soli]